MQQINDSQFPIGSYSHSYGFETYIQERTIENEEDSKTYLINYLSGPFLYTDLFSTYLAYRATKDQDLNSLEELNLYLRALKSQKELREASEKLGSRLIKTLAEMDLDFDFSFFEKFLDRMEKRDLPVHHSLAYGMTCALAGIDLDLTLSSFCFSIATSMTSNAVKTIPISQMAGQRILFSIGDLIEKLVERVKELDRDELGISFPGVEISSMRHEHLYSRLYMS